jgi:hypothetical protein
VTALFWLGVPVLAWALLYMLAWRLVVRWWFA